MMTALENELGLDHHARPQKQICCFAHILNLVVKVSNNFCVSVCRVHGCLGQAIMSPLLRDMEKEDDKANMSEIMGTAEQPDNNNNEVDADREGSNQSLVDEVENEVNTYIVVTSAQRAAGQSSLSKVRLLCAEVLQSCRYLLLCI